jgi:hypothetical protein
MLVTIARRRIQLHLLDESGARRAALPAIATDARDAGALVGIVPFEGGYFFVRAGVRGECPGEACAILRALDAAGAPRGEALAVDVAPDARFASAVVSASRVLVHLDLPGRDDDAFVIESRGGTLSFVDRRTFPTAAEAPCPEGVAHPGFDGVHVGAFVHRGVAPPGQRGPTCPGLVAIVDRSHHASAAVPETIREVIFEGDQLTALTVRDDGSAARVLRWRSGGVGVDERSIAAGERPPPAFDVLDAQLRAGDDPRRAIVRIRRRDGAALGEPLDLGPTGRASFSARSGGRFWIGELLGAGARARVRITPIDCR